MRQAGIFAAAGIYALNNNVKRLKEDQDKAIYLAKELKKYINTSSENIVQNTNMVFFYTSTKRRAALMFIYEQQRYNFKSTFTIYKNGNASWHYW